MTLSRDTQVTAPALELRGLWAGYGATPALQDVSLAVAQGQFMGIIGPNGAGKSTLFKAILGLVKPWRGDTLVFGRPSREMRAAIGYMPQIELVDWDFPVTVADVALMGRYGPLGLLRRPAAADRDAADQALERAGMLPLRDRLVGELSGGQRRRVLLARALVNNPRLLLLDEPMAGLDAAAQHQLLDILAGLRAQGATIVMNTHDLSCVSSSCDRACCLQRAVVALGAPHEVLTEKILSQTFGIHLLTVHHPDGSTYAYQHHHIGDAPEPSGLHHD
ncbi:MAG: metal ABC transporter ATP-binding protein [Dehalococcoidia bacterium]|nr:metal ABC transporter ATP-binding protein [Dehalococcoidia bacterium]